MARIVYNEKVMGVLTHFISSYFPPPQALLMPQVGVDLSDRSVKFVYLKKHASKLKLASYGSAPIPEGHIQNGVIQKPDEVGAILRDLLAKSESSFVALSLPEEKAYVFTLSFTGVERRDLHSAIELQLESHVPLAPEASIFDFDIIEEKSPNTTVAVSVFPKDVVESYVAVIRAAALMPVRFEIEAQSVARALVARGDKRACIIVDLGRSRTGFAIVSGGIVQHSATVPIGGDALTNALVTRLNLSPEIAKKTKENRGLLRTKDNEEVCQVLSGAASALRDEIGKHYEFWNKRSPSAISAIYICGGDANIPGMREYLSTGFSVPVEYGNPWVNILSATDPVPEIEFNESLQFTSALGLALASFE